MTSSPPHSDLFSQVLDEGRRANPYPLYRRMQEHPVLEGPPGVFVVTRWTGVHRLLRDRRLANDLRRRSDEDPERGKDRRGKGMREPSFLFLDPPDHTRLRSLVAGEFRPRLIARLRAHLVQLVHELLDAAAERGRLEFVEDLAQPLPLAVICDLLGVPREDVPRFRDWSRAMAHMLEPEMTIPPEERYTIARALIGFQAYVGDLVDNRRASPRDDYISGLIAAREGTDALSEQEIKTTLTLLLVAGHETTTNLLSNAMLALLRHPEELAKLKEEPLRVSAIVEETLRHDPPVQLRNRRALADISVDGYVIPADSYVILLLAAANRDPRRFPAPDRFMPERPESRHVAFGAGPHFCIGAALARLEAEIALTALAQRLENPRLSGEELPYRRSASVHGPVRLDIEFDAIRPREGGRNDRLLGSIPVG